MLENHEVYIFSSPQLQIEIEETDTRLESKDSSVTLIITVIKNTIIGIIIGLVIFIGIFLLKELFSQKLNYCFGYDTGDFDDFIIYNKDNEDTVIFFINVPHVSSKLILTEDNLTKE